MSGTHFRNRHTGSSSQQGVAKRSTHTGGSDAYDPGRDGISVVDSRSGEQVQLPDLAPGSVDTPQFFPTAKAPQVNNNPFSPGNATVTIDEEGLHVADGAIFITDASGQSVLSAAGFRGSWLDFIATGIYNGTFAAGAGVAATKPSRQEVITEADLPYWDILRAAGATSANMKVYHGSAAAANYLMEARLWAENAPLDSYMGLQQLVPLSHAISARGIPDGGVSIEVPTRSVDANANYQLQLHAQQYGFDPTANALIALGSVYTSSAGFGGALNTMIPTLNSLTTHLLIEIRITRVGLGDNTAAEVAILNSRIVPSQRSLMLEGLGTAGRVARLYTSAAVGDVQMLEIDPSLGGNDDKKSTQIKGDLILERGGTGALVLELRGSLDATGGVTQRFYNSGDAYFRILLGHSAAGVPSLKFGGGAAGTDVTLERLAAGSLSVLGRRERGAGTSFPSAPVSGDNFYRSDRGLEYFYNGARWLTKTLYRLPLQSLSTGVWAVGATASRASGPTGSTSAWWLENFESTAYVVAPNSGANYWTMTLQQFDSAGPAATIVSVNTSAATGADQYVGYAAAINSLLASTVEAIQVSVTPTGAPGNLIWAGGTLVYRLEG